MSNLLAVLGLERTYENAKAVLLQPTGRTEWSSPEEIPSWVRELDDFEDPFEELEESEI